MAQSFEVSGLRELEQALLSLGAATAQKALMQAAKKAMKPVLAAAIDGANEDKGNMRRTLAIRGRKGKGSARAVNVMVGSFKTSYTDKSSGTSVKTKLSRQHQKVIAQEYGTSDQAAKPFLRPALTKNTSAVLAAFKTELANSIDKAAKRAAARAR
jgi:HK97 gp10 family phage protein